MIAFLRVLNAGCNHRSYKRFMVSCKVLHSGDLSGAGYAVLKGS